MRPPRTVAAPVTVDELLRDVRLGALGPAPATLHVVGAFWIRQSTQFAGTPHKYRTHYILVRVGSAFGACCVERGELESDVAEELSGQSVASLLDDPRLPVRIAALDAYLGEVFPHRDAALAHPRLLPLGPPLERARARDAAIVSLPNITPGRRVALIGVVNPLVAAIQEQGATCLPCDLNMEHTQDGLPVEKDMTRVLEQVDLVIATGMTLANGSFDVILESTRRRQVPLVVYAQTGSAIVARFVGHGVSALSAEPFPFSQFSADPTPLYLYRSGRNDG